MWDMLGHILGLEDYALCLAPGFFRFYAHIGVLQGLGEAGCLRVSHLSGCSAGALVATFLAAGVNPSEMAQKVLAIKRSDVWDMGGIGGLLKGELFRAKVAEHLPVQTFAEAKIPLAVTAFDLGRMRTNCIVEGELALAARASCTFPGLFQPALLEGSPHIDGGVWDHDGIMALEACFQRTRSSSATVPEEGQRLAADRKLIVNVVFDRVGSSSLPKAFSNCRLLTLVVENVPGVGPFSMEEMGPVAFDRALRATRQALQKAHIMELAPNHWVAYLDASLEVIGKPLAELATAWPITAKSAEEQSSHSSVSTSLLPPSESAAETECDSAEEARTVLHCEEQEDQQGIGEKVSVTGTIELFTAPRENSSGKTAGDTQTVGNGCVEDNRAGETESLPASSLTSASRDNSLHRIPSYSFITGSFHLYQSLSRGMASASESLDASSSGLFNSLFPSTPAKRRAAESIDSCDCPNKIAKNG